MADERLRGGDDTGRGIKVKNDKSIERQNSIAANQKHCIDQDESHICSDAKALQYAWKHCQVGTVIAGFSVVRHLMFDPDVNVSRDRRETPTWERYDTEEGKTLSRNRHHLANLKPNPINTFEESAALKEGTDEPFSKHL
ncbi:unnamed protein product [Peronospora belbahrii]|uniref:Uncharacterized protein n=1 Tax=Peronospora belbahrii TaxID=622444 RepID=A0ABN8CLG6_9STRA|nr:unnamed protein product [Peronospora belbahrii]